MALQLSLKYRPKDFHDVVCHEEIKNVLINAISASYIQNAFLFYGESGTGKTTIARIFAKALNCKKKVDGFNPCNECSSCKEIDNLSNPDVFEIDAASRNTVDSVRELIDGVKYLPVSSKYKIYILDEVHMFSNSAFNSLLKILEEPPFHVRFFLCTTEYHKIPKTVVSRCQKFNFKKIPHEMIKNRLKKICELESINASDGAVFDILAKIANGSMRDSISLLDQVSILTDKKINVRDLVSILGYQEDDEIFIDLIDMMLNHNNDGAIMILNDLYERNISCGLFFERILDIIANLIVEKTTSGQMNFFMNQFLQSKVENLLKKYQLSTLNELRDILSNGYKSLNDGFYRNSFNLLKVTILRGCYIVGDNNSFIVHKSNSLDKKEVESNNIEDKLIESKNVEKVDKNVEEIIIDSNIKSCTNKVNVEKNESKEKKFDHDKFIKMLYSADEIEMAELAKKSQKIFNYEKLEIYDGNVLPAKYLQFFVKILRQYDKKWKIVIVDNNDDFKEVEQNEQNILGIDSNRIDDIDDNKSKKDEFDNIKNKFINSSELLKDLNKNFNINNNKIRVSK